MSNDISTMYSKEQQQKNGRKGYGAWRSEKETVISPRHYGMFIQDKKRRKK